MIHSQKSQEANLSALEQNVDVEGVNSEASVTMVTSGTSQFLPHQSPGVSHHVRRPER